MESEFRIHTPFGLRRAPSCRPGESGRGTLSSSFRVYWAQTRPPAHSSSTAGIGPSFSRSCVVRTGRSGDTEPSSCSPTALVRELLPESYSYSTNDISFSPSPSLKLFSLTGMCDSSELSPGPWGSSEDPSTSTEQDSEYSLSHSPDLCSLQGGPLPPE